MSQMLIPNTVTEACQMLSSGNRVACAGATNLYVDREKGKYLDRDIVSLHRLKELSGIREEKDGWHIGSLTTFDLIEDVFRGQGSMDALAEAASLVGGPQIRNRGTIGGNKLPLLCRRIFHRLMIFVQREVIEKLWQPMWYCSL